MDVQDQDNSAGCLDDPRAHNKISVTPEYFDRTPRWGKGSVLASCHFFKFIEFFRKLLVISKNGLAPVTTVEHVIDRPGESDSRFSGRLTKSCPNGPKCQTARTDPF